MPSRSLHTPPPIHPRFALEEIGRIPEMKPIRLDTPLRGAHSGWTPQTRPSKIRPTPCHCRMPESEPNSGTPAWVFRPPCLAFCPCTCPTRNEALPPDTHLRLPSCVRGATCPVSPDTVHTHHISSALRLTDPLAPTHAIPLKMAFQRQDLACHCRGPEIEPNSKMNPGTPA